MFAGIFNVISIVIGLRDVLGKALSLGICVLEATAKGLTAFGNALGLLETDDPVEMGIKRIQAENAGIEPDVYDSYDEYLDAVNNFEIDEASAAEIPLEKKLLKGAQHATEAIDRKFPDSEILNVAEGIVENPEFYDDDRFAALAELVSNDPDKIAIIGKLLMGKLEGDEYYDAIDMIVSAEQTKHPELTIEEIEERVQKSLA